MRELFCPPVLTPKTTGGSKAGKKGAQTLTESRTKLVKQVCVNEKPLLTHRAASCVEDGPSLGGVHHHLLQALEALLRQLLSVSDEPSQSAVHRVVGHDLDQLWEVVTVPLTAHKR